jgi:hypothetical protein
LSLGQALAEIDRRLPPEGPSGAENDNGRAHEMREPLGQSEGHADAPEKNERPAGPRFASGELF